MAKLQKLDDDEIATRLREIPHWTLQDGKLHRELRFGSFVEAFGFMTQVAILAEKKNHHPEWFNVYNRVVIDLETHDVSGISASDFDLAQAIDAVATASGRTGGSAAEPPG